MSFCLTKITSFSPSLCYSVFKKTSASLCHYVIMSSKKTSVSLCHYVIMSSKKHLSLFLIMSFCLQKNICLSFSLGHYVGHQRIQNLDKTVQKKQKRGCAYNDTPSFIMLLPRRGNQFPASFSSTFSVFGFWCKTKIMARAMAAVIIPAATQSCPNIASNADMTIRIMTIE